MYPKMHGTSKGSPPRAARPGIGVARTLSSGEALVSGLTVHYLLVNHGGDLFILKPVKIRSGKNKLYEILLQDIDWVMTQLDDYWRMKSQQQRT